MDTDKYNSIYCGVLLSSPDGIEAQSTDHSTTKNVCLHCYDAPALPDIVYCAECLKIYQDEYAASLLPQCHLCWRHAEHIYHTTAWRNFPSETLYLCAIHIRAACGLLIKEPDIRAEVEREYEASLLYEDEPYYSRADEMADQANADYYDEVARGGRVA